MMPFGVASCVSPGCGHTCARSTPASNHLLSRVPSCSSACTTWLSVTDHGRRGVLRAPNIPWYRKAGAHQSTRAADCFLPTSTVLVTAKRKGGACPTKFKNAHDTHKNVKGNSSCSGFTTPTMLRQNVSSLLVYNSFSCLRCQLLRIR